MLKVQDVVRIKGETECLCESMLIKSIVHKGGIFLCYFPIKVILPSSSFPLHGREL